MKKFFLVGYSCGLYIFSCSSGAAELQSAIYLSFRLFILQKGYRKWK